MPTLRESAQEALCALNEMPRHALTGAFEDSYQVAAALAGALKEEEGATRPSKGESFCKKVWLTDSPEPSTSSVTCFHGLVKWHKNPEGEECSWIEIANCSDKARLHRTYGMTHGEWVDQVRRLRDELSTYLTFLDPQEVESSPSPEVDSVIWPEVDSVIWDRDPNYICRGCAVGMGAEWPPGHCATMSPGLCVYCGRTESLASVDDWDWRGCTRPKVKGAGRD